MKKLTVIFLLAGLFVSQKTSAQEKEIPCGENIIMCAQRLHGNYIINNQADYQALLSDRSSHSNCGSYQLPVIDFTTHTLLGVRNGAGGCRAPKIEHRVFEYQNKIIFESTVTEFGICKMDHGYSVWCLVDKIRDINKIEFQQNYKFLPSDEQERKLIEEYIKQQNNKPSK